MNFWIFSSNKQVIAYKETPIIKASNALNARIIVSELNTGKPGLLKLSPDGKYIIKNNIRIASVLTKPEILYNIFNPKQEKINIHKPQQVNFEKIFEPIEEKPIIEEIPKEEKVEVTIIDYKPISQITQQITLEPIIEKKDGEKDGENTGEKIEETSGEPTLVGIPEEGKNEEKVEEKIEEKIEEQKPRKKRKYTKRKK